MNFSSARSFFSKPILLPVLLAIFNGLYSFNVMSDWDFSFTSLGICLFFLTLTSLLIYFASRWIIKESNAASIASGILLTWIFFFENIRNALSGIQILHPILFRYTILIPVFFAGMILCFFLFRRSQSNFKKSIPFLHLFLILLVMMELFKLSLFGIKRFQREEFQYIKTEKFSLPKTLPAVLPDIYYILFDSRTSPEALEKYWNYSDTLLTNHLKAKGFYVVPDAHSNYMFTELCMSATFNMGYFNEIQSRYPNVNMDKVCIDLIQHAVVPALLDSAGYEFVNLSPFTIGTHRKFYANRFFMSLSSLLWSKSFPGKVYNETILSQVLAEHFYPETLIRDAFPVMTKKICRTVCSIASKEHDKPQFVYAHFMLPHSPFMLDRNGNLLPKKVSTDLSDNDEKYLEQLMYANKLAMEMTDTILAHSKIQPIIIIQGDHGFRFLSKSGQFEEASCILNAYYLPDSARKLLYPHITPVNSFRLVLNEVLKTSLPLKPDSTFSGTPITLKKALHHL